MIIGLVKPKGLKMQQQKLVEFNNNEVKRTLAATLGVHKNSLQHLIMPATGTHLTIGEIVYRVAYVRSNPYRMSLEPVGVLDHSEETKTAGVDRSPSSDVDPLNK